MSRPAYKFWLASADLGVAGHCQQGRSPSPHSVAARDRRAGDAPTSLDARVWQGVGMTSIAVLGAQADGTIVKELRCHLQNRAKTGGLGLP